MGPRQMRRQLRLRHALGTEGKSRTWCKSSPVLPNGDVQETGASNFILIKGNEIITKPLTDEFLHGVTRDSVLTVAKDLGYTVSERNFTVDELKAAVEEGAEAILTGTAAVISPVTSFVIDGKEIEVKSQERGYALRKALTDIQYGLAEDKHGWLVEVC